MPTEHGECAQPAKSVIWLVFGADLLLGWTSSSKEGGRICGVTQHGGTEVPMCNFETGIISKHLPLPVAFQNE